MLVSARLAAVELRCDPAFLEGLVDDVLLDVLDRARTRRPAPATSPGPIPTAIRSHHVAERATAVERRTAGPRSSLVVKEDRISIAGARDAWCYTLDEPQQGRVGVRLELGERVAWCAESPAKARGNPPSTAQNDRVDVFKGLANAPAPAACPMVPRAAPP
jgi:hypothetical protein